MPGPSTKHPEFLAVEDLYQTMSDCYDGERTIKTRGQRYLPATQGQLLDGARSGNSATVGSKSYEAYKMRAVFHNFVRDAVDTYLGMLHQEPCSILVPDSMKPMIESLGVSGESAQMVLRDINMNQLLYGRCGLLLDVASGLTVDKALPYVAVYSARSIVNWDDGTIEQGKQRIELLTLDETSDARVGMFEWERKPRWRVLMAKNLVDSIASPDQAEPAAADGWMYAVVDDGNVDVSPSSFRPAPEIGGRSLATIPFVFVGCCSLSSSPELPPLERLANVCLAIYRGEADHRQALHMQGMDTLVTIGTETPEEKFRLGPGGGIHLPMGSDAKFIGVSAAGLEAQSAAIERDKRTAQEYAGRVADSSEKGNAYSSGSALVVRGTARTATLKSIAETGAHALQEILRMAARWLGANPDEVKCEANTKFITDVNATRSLLELAQAKVLGGIPISAQSMHRLLRKHDLTAMTHAEELAILESEAPLISTQRPADDAAPKRGA